MAYELIENKEKREATIRMYGVIGRDVDGNRMAYDIANLDKEADTIHILINSDGGSVSQGVVGRIGHSLGKSLYPCACEWHCGKHGCRHCDIVRQGEHAGLCKAHDP